jgi:hypothetical protein
MSQITIRDFEGLFDHFCENNKDLVEKGMKPTAIALNSTAGIGKTAIVEELAKEREMNFVKLNLAQLEEVGDLVGCPFKEFLVVKGEGDKKKSKWVTENMIPKMLEAGYALKGKPRTSYAVPSWVPKDAKNGTVLLLDDWTRASNVFIQAVMELIDKGEYVSWKLPKNTIIVLTENPEGGDYNVAEIDPAQRSRYITFKLKFDVECWAKWAQSVKIRDEFINFALFYNDILFKERNNVIIANARNYTTFCLACQSLDISTLQGRGLVNTIAEGCFPDDKNNVIGTSFDTFIRRKLNLLPTPKHILGGKFEDVLRELYGCVYEGSNYSAEIGTVLATRLLAFIEDYFSKPGSKAAPVEDRLIKLLDATPQVFTVDMVFYIVKNLISKHRGRITKLIAHPAIKQKLI